MKKRKGDFIQLYSGTRFYPLDPRPEEILIEDIAHALSNICRFTGHTKKFISVAEHSINVSNLLPGSLKLQGLLHDASEAYLLDFPRPLKYLPEFAEYRKMEKKIQKMIFKKFGIEKEAPVVKLADEHVLYYEGKLLMDLSGWDDPERFNHNIIFKTGFTKMECLEPKAVERKFLYMFALLTSVTHSQLCYFRESIK